MKILFVASNPSNEVGLQLDKEITEIQQRANIGQSGVVEFVFLPDLSLEQLNLELNHRHPDVLHLSAHGSREALALRRGMDESEVAVKAETLLSFLNPEYPPQLIYINACNSDELARRLVGRVPFAIGTTAPISNSAARAGAVSFYDRLLSGCSVADAFEAQKGVIEALEDERTTVEIFVAPGNDPSAVILHPVPRLEADFEDDIKPAKDGHYAFALRVVGCPANTTQVVFFTDDEDFLEDEDDEDDDEYNYEEDLTYVVRGTPIGPNRVLTTYEDQPWRANGDFRLFAVGVTGDSRMFTASAMLSEALKRRYRSGMPPSVERVLGELLMRNGAADQPMVQYRPQKVKKKRLFRPNKRKEKQGKVKPLRQGNR